MKTQVIMLRPFLGSEIRQQSKTSFFSATDLVKIVNKKRSELGRPMFNFSAYLKSKSTIEFIQELQSQNDKVIIRSKGKNNSTWVHPFLFIDIALSCDPKLKIEVYGWLYDELIKARNNSGDSYKKMCGYLFENQQNKKDFPSYIVSVANYIKKMCQCQDWEKATQEQLKIRDKMHDNIAILTTALRDNDQAVRIGVNEALKDLGLLK